MREHAAQVFRKTQVEGLRGAFSALGVIPGGSTEDKCVSIDGKCVRIASKMSLEKNVHIVSARVGENAMPLAQVKVADKSNENHGHTRTH